MRSSLIGKKAAASRENRKLRLFLHKTDKNGTAHRDTVHHGTDHCDIIHNLADHHAVARRRPDQTGQTKISLPVRRPLFTLLLGIAAAIWITVLLFPWKPTDYEPFRKKRICLTGTVCGMEPGIEGEQFIWKMILKDVEIDSPAHGITVEKDYRVLCILDREPDLEMSSRVQVQGTVYPFRRARNEGGFDSLRYYHILRTAFSLRDVRILACSDAADHLGAFLYRLKRFLSDVIDRIFSEQASPVLKSMLLGEKGLLEAETKELYQGAGIVHIFSISGLHLSLIGMGFFTLSGRLRLLVPAGAKSSSVQNAGGVTVKESGSRKTGITPRRIPLPFRAACSLALIFLYGKMVGTGTSVFRAVIMLSIYIVSKAIGRTYDLLTAAGLAAVLLLVDQPLYIYHTGFQFSFAAVLSIGILMPALPGKLLKGLAVPLGTLPVYLWMGGTFPVYSLVLNLIVIPLMTVVMVSAGCAVFLGSIAGTTAGSSGSGGGILQGAILHRAILHRGILLRGISQGRFLQRKILQGRFLQRKILQGRFLQRKILQGRFLQRVSLQKEVMHRGVLQTVSAGIRSALFYAARIAGLPAEWILKLYRLLVEVSGNLPYHEIVLGRPAPAQIILYYTMLLIMSALSVFLQMPHARRRIERKAVSDIGGSFKKAKGYGCVSGNAGVTTIRIKTENAESSQLVGLSGYSEHAAGHLGQISGERLILAVRRLCSAARLKDNRERRRFASFCAAGWIGVCILMLIIRIPPSFEMDVLYVGQGDGIFISAGGRYFLIDGGSSTEDELAKYTLLPFLHCKGVSSLDGVILSHEDVDHCSGLLAFLESAGEGKEKIGIKTIYLPDISSRSKGKNYLRIVELAEKTGIPIGYISRGQCIRSGELTMECLHPEKGAYYDDGNAYSTTLYLRYRQFSALLTGDLEGDGETDLLDYIAGNQTGSTDPGLDISVLKVAHHGSRFATSEDFLKIVHPDAAVISAGYHNLYGHPHEELLQRLSGFGIPYERTDESGMIQIRPGRGKLTMDTFSGK